MTVTPLRVVIVDDNESDRGVARRFLQRDFPDVIIDEYELGEPGLAAVATRAPDCLLLDVDLPDTDGLAFLTRLAANGDIPCPIVILTGHTDERLAVRATSLGAHGYVLKDRLSRDGLRHAVVTAMAGWRLRAQLAGQSRELTRRNTELERAKHRALVALSASGGWIYEWSTATNEFLVDGDFWDHIGESPHSIDDIAALWRSRIHPDDCEEVFARRRDAIAVGGSFIGDYRIAHSHGHYLTVHERGVCLREENGDCRVVAITIDITHLALERRCIAIKLAVADVLTHAETLSVALPRIEMSLGDGMEPVDIQVWLVDSLTGELEPGSSVPPNRIGSRAANSGPWSELLARRLWTTLASTSEMAAQARDEAGTAEPREEFAFAVSNKDVPIGVVALRAVAGGHIDPAIRRAAPEIGRNLGEFIRRMSAEQTLRDTASRLELALHAAQLGTWDWDVVRDDISWSGTLAPHAVVDADSFGGGFQGFLGLVHPEDRERIREAIRITLADDVVYEVEFRMLRPDGGFRWTYSKGRVLRDEHGRPVRMLGIDVDISERKLREDEQEMFLADVSHDLNNPLAAMRAQLQLAQRKDRRGTLDSTSTRQLLSTLDRSIQGMSVRINELSDVSRLRSGRSLELDVTQADLVSIVEAGVAMYQATTSEHTFELQSVTGPLIGLWDVARLSRVVDNLLSNAVKYSPDGGIVSVQIQRVERNKRISALLRVVDRGIGIPEFEMTRVFERYRRGSNVAGRIYGLGIGLSGAKLMVEEHGGTIEVTSQIGVGSTFTVLLPLSAEAVVN